MDQRAASCSRCGAILAPTVLVCARCGQVVAFGNRLTPSAPVFPVGDTQRRIPSNPALHEETEDANALPASARDPDAHDAAGAHAAREALTADGADGDTSSDARFRNGDTILGHYTVVKQLGRGGMGTVYLARDEVSGQEVAVKVLPASLARERDIRDRFTQEARALASMDHPNIVPLVTYAQEGEDRFLVMKYLQGESLDARLRRIGVLPPEHARRVLRAVLSALGYAHARGVIHRDVKPSNVIIEGDLDTSEHRVFLVDFGIAKKDVVEGEDAHKLTQTGMLMGTPQYMSPEQISGHKVDGRSDIYAAGLVLFEMLAGRPPFDGQKTFQVLRAHVEQPVPDVREARGSPIPDDLVALTYLLLRKDPNERPKNSTDAIALLDGTSSFPPSPATPLTTSVAPPASPSWPPTAKTVADDTAATVKHIPMRSDAELDDPSMEEIAAVRSRGRAGFVAAAIVVLAAGATAAVLWKPWNRGDDPVASKVDSGSATADERGAGTKAALMLLEQNARSKLKAGDPHGAYDAIAAVVDEDPSDADARSLQVDVLVALESPDDAETALVALKQLIATDHNVDAATVAHVPEQEASIAQLAAKRGKTKPVDPPKTRPTSDNNGSSPSSPIASKDPVSMDALKRAVALIRPALSSCYSEHVQVKDPNASGDLTFAVKIAPSGKVESVDVKKATGGKLFDNGAFQRCVAGEIRKWRFNPWKGTPTTVPYVASFHPTA